MKYLVIRITIENYAAIISLAQLQKQNTTTQKLSNKRFALIKSLFMLRQIKETPSQTMFSFN